MVNDALAVRLFEVWTHKDELVSYGIERCLCNTINLRYSDMDDAHKLMAIMEVTAITRWKLHQLDEVDTHKKIAISQIIAVTRIAKTKVHCRHCGH